MQSSITYPASFAPYDSFNGLIVTWMQTGGLTKPNVGDVMAVYKGGSVNDPPKNYTSWERDPWFKYYWPQPDEAYATLLA